MQHLDGVQAVAYARLRLMDTDYKRTARQRLVISLAMEKAKQADFKTLTTVINTVLPQISTSIGLNDLLPLAKNMKKFHIGENGGFPFSRGETYIGKKDCVIPLTLESNVIQLHQFLYDDMEYQPSQVVKKISAQIAADSGMGDVAENAPESKVGGSTGSSGNSSSEQESQTQPPVQEVPVDTGEEILEGSSSADIGESLPEESSSLEETKGDDGSEGETKEEIKETEETIESTKAEPGADPGESSPSEGPPGHGSEPGSGGPGGPGSQPGEAESFPQSPEDAEHTEPIGPGSPGLIS